MAKHHTPFYYLYMTKANLMKKLLWLIIVLMSMPATAQYDFSIQCNRAHTLITSLKFQEANAVLDSIKAQDPDNLIPVLLENYRDFLTVIVGEEERVFDSLKIKLPGRLEVLKEGKRDSPWHRSLIAQLYLQWAFARVKFGEYFTAAREIRKAFLLLEENQEVHPGFLPDQVGLGIMHALIGTVPDNFRWIASLFSMEGSVELGRQELFDVLHRAQKEGYPYLEGEALFFLSFLELNLQPDKMKARELLPYYEHQPDDNMMLLFSKAQILTRTANNDQAIELLMNRPEGEDYYPFYYLDFLLGLAKLHRLDEDADQYFLRFTANFKGNAYVKEGYQKLAWHSLLLGRPGMYHHYMEMAIQYGNDFTDGDRLALAEARSGVLPNPCLLKGRLLYDGGYYARADSLLRQLNCHLRTERDSIEYPYRLGRIAHAMERYHEAMRWYDETILSGQDASYYYAANAALKAGNICEMQGRLELAGQYYRKCIKMPNREYRRSMQQKAKAGLNRIRDKQKD
jgi:tetratricopeptide (TPR) repeat protein